MEERGLEEVPLLQLRAQLQERRLANALLQTEVEMFEKWRCKMEPRSTFLPPRSETKDAQPEPAQARRRSRLYSTTNYSVGLTVEQKCELAEREITEVQDEIQRIKEDSEKTLQNLETVIEEADVWWTDVKKAIRDFEKNVTSQKGSIVDSEKLLRYLKVKNRQKDLLRVKLCCKNDLLKSYKKKLQQQLRQKDQMGETLCEVHLQQLHVRNAQYQDEIGERNQEVMQIKLTSGKTVQVLNFYKRKLQDTMEMSRSLMKDISQRKKLLEKMEREAAVVEEQRAKAESVNRQLRNRLSDYSVPSVMSYVQKTTAVTDLENSLKAWERKVAVAEMSLKSYRRTWNRVKMSGNQH